jgi:5-methyltetrahydrofolate--homocysteine methyltransferase
MVPPEEIVSKAISEQVDVVALSGLITPSLDEMVNVAVAMERAGLRIPILIGGATSSRMHVALKIAPVYSGMVVWMKDAAQNVVAISQLLNADEAPRYRKELLADYERLRQEYAQNQQQLRPLDEARRNRLRLFDNA